MSQADRSGWRDTRFDALADGWERAAGLTGVGGGDGLLAEGWSAADTRGRGAATQDAYEAVPAGERDTLDPQELVVGAAARALLEPRDPGCLGGSIRR